MGNSQMLNKLKKHIRKNAELLFESTNEDIKHTQHYSILISNLEIDMSKMFEGLLRRFRFRFRVWENEDKKNYLINIPYEKTLKTAQTFSRLTGFQFKRFFCREVFDTEYLESLEDSIPEFNLTKNECQKATINQFILRFKDECQFSEKLSIQKFSENVARSSLGTKYNLRKNDITYANYYANTKTLKDTLKLIEENENIVIKSGYLKSTIVRVIKLINKTYEATIEYER